MKTWVIVVASNFGDHPAPGGTVIGEFTTPDQPIPRDRYGRPLIVPPDGGKPVAYTRCTTYVDALEDTYNLTQWEKRLVAIGLADRADLLLAVSAHRDNKAELNKITNQAKEAARASAAATTGTAVHALTERVDRGEPLPALPESAQRDLDAYRRRTEGVYTSLAIERFSVYDPFRIGGTPDRHLLMADTGKVHIGDVKTGDIDWGAMKIAMQLSVYSRAVPYNHSTGEREPVDYEIDQEWGLVIHLPAGSGNCELRWIDIAAGWDAVLVAKSVREWRKFKDWYQPCETHAEETEVVQTAWASLVQGADSVEKLRDIWAEADARGQYTPDLHALCVARKTELENSTAP